MTKVTISQVFLKWKDEFKVPEKDARKMTAITLRETGNDLDTNKHNYDPPRDDSYGIYQINMLAHSNKTTVACATNFDCSSDFAFGLYKANGFRDWAGTQDEAGLAPFYAIVDKEIPSVKGGTTAEVSWQDNLKEGVKDFIVILALELVALLCIGIGLWGLVSGKGSISGSISSATNSVTKLAKTGAKALVAPTAAAKDVARGAKKVIRSAENGRDYVMNNNGTVSPA